ncbi:MAG: B12-binding domain-containing radical SAM protein [Candidatus Omnitrophica bacterium]|nr:B12-binding domain-containing radical SAM protein [Candidatus Omnitrophota bacterium]
MSDVILFRPKAANKLSGRYPVGLIYIATPIIQKGITVKIIDQEASPDWKAELEQHLSSSTICVGVSVMTGVAIKFALEFSEAVKKIHNTPVIWGGIHPSFLPAETLANIYIDIVVIGEGDYKFLRVIEQIKNNQTLENINGIAFKESGQIKFTKPEKEFIDLNQLPVPEFGLANLGFYKKSELGFPEGTVLHLNVDRGCPYRCAFCYNIRFNDRKWRAMSSSRIISQLEELIPKHKPSAINFISDNLFVDKNRVRQLCQALADKAFNLPWHADMRVDTFLHYEDDLILLIKKSGCQAITFGVESGSDRVLRLINKDITVSDVVKAHKRALKFGFALNYHFMIGFPEETKKDIIQTVKLSKLLTQDDHVNVWGPAMYVPYPGTPLFDKSCQMGFVPPKKLENWIDYDWEDTSKLPFLTKDFKNYINEVQTICRGSLHRNMKQGIIKKLIYLYSRFRLNLLLSGVRFFDLDTKLMRIIRDKKTS